MVRIAKHRKPTHAGEILLKVFLEPMHLYGLEAIQRMKPSMPLNPQPDP
ncbi:MAG: hypothetical protein JJU29_18385 [Verrucomicrobia bacterium]|nr:hypothetical protein [Verrucomicrobiota bacterium]MCH8513949.1 hypothetical protein [Kiritimatiellia bacterium]